MDLPTRDGWIVTSAEYGHSYAVEIFYATDADGRRIDPGTEEYPRTLHGPFVDEAEAIAWVEAYPDDDTDIEDILVIVLNNVRPTS